VSRTALLSRLLLACCASAAFGENHIRVESPADGRNYTIDTDKTGVRRWLRPLNPARLPDWLYPGPDAQPADIRYEPASGIAIANFVCGGTLAQVSAFYEQALRAHGLRVTNPGSSAAGAVQLTGNSAHATVSLSLDARTGSVRVRVTYAPRDPPRREFQVLWYDDRIGILRLRDNRSGDEFELDKRGIVANNLNRPGAVPSEGARMPSWLPVYPGATASPKGRITWLKDPTAEFVTNDSIRQVYDFYKAQLPATGARLRESSLIRSGNPPQDFSAEFVATLGDDKVEVEIEIGRTMGGFQPGVLGKSMPKLLPPQTGIGIVYSVPKR